jgi:Cdc6-like AAA superfamily ATPase
METLDYSKLAICTRIIIDGDPGSGKTTLAEKLASKLGIRFISFDDFLLENGAPYCEQIKYEALRREILGHPKLIIEGVCALKILSKIDVFFDCHIFIKQLNGIIGWEMGDYLTVPQRREPKSKLTKEVVKYYRDFKPFENPNQSGLYYISLSNSIN